MRLPCTRRYIGMPHLRHSLSIAHKLCWQELPMTGRSFYVQSIRR